MSIRASLFSFLIRRMLKDALTDMKDVQPVRERLDGRRAAKIPDRVAVVPVKAGGVDCEWITTDQTEQNRVILYFHGGGYVFGGLNSHRSLGWHLADAAGMRMLLVDYRLAPEHPFPAAVDDAAACYRFLLDEGYRPEHIAIAGDSAGGGLSLATMVNLKNLGLPLPACAALLSPWLDLSLSGDSVSTQADTDVMLSPSGLKDMADHYLAGRDAKAPLASPLFAELSGLPPMLVHASTTEVLRSDAERLETLIRGLDGEIELVLWEKLPHMFQVFAGMMPEADKAVKELGRFLAQHTESQRITDS